MKIFRTPITEDFQDTHNRKIFRKDFQDTHRSGKIFRDFQDTHRLLSF